MNWLGNLLQQGLGKRLAELCDEGAVFHRASVLFRVTNDP